MPDEGGELPEFWWQGEDGTQIIRTIWAAAEGAFRAGADAKVRLSKPGQPTLTIAFEHDAPRDDEGF